MEPLPALTAEQREEVCELVRADRLIGNVAAMRKAGLRGSRGQLRALIDDDFAEQLLEARGWQITKVEDAAWTVAIDTQHPAWDRANARVLKAHHPAYRDIARHELTGRDGGPIELLAGRFDPDQLTLEELEQVRGLLEKAQPRELESGGDGAR